MRFTHWLGLLLASTIGLAACVKAIDPAYLEREVKYAETYCACAKLSPTEAQTCARGVKWPGDATPTGEPSGTYEHKLKAEDQAKLEAARKLKAACATAIFPAP